MDTFVSEVNQFYQESKKKKCKAEELHFEWHVALFITDGKGYSLDLFHVY
jgi:hypothetical protein